LVERKALNLVVKGSSPFFGDRTFYFELFYWQCSEAKIRWSNWLASAVFSQLISVLTMHAAKTIAESGN